MRDRAEGPFVVCLVGRSESGKTTLMERLIPALKKMGLRVGTVKHHLGKLTLDQPGKDSFRHREAGAEISMIATPGLVGMVMALDHDPSLEELVVHMREMDMVLCEGYKHSSFPKIEVFRKDLGGSPMFLGDETLMALVTEEEGQWRVPVFSPFEPDALAAFLAGKAAAGTAQSRGIP